MKVHIRFRQVGRLRCAGGSSRLAGDDHGFPGAVRDRVGLVGLPGRLALARRVSLPGLRQAPRVGARATSSLGVRGLSSADVGDRGHGHARDSHAASIVVWAAYLVATHHPGISAKQLPRQLGLARYETAWLILQKLRRAMVAPEREPLKREVELDEFFLGGHDPWTDRRQRGKKALVGAAIEVRGGGSGRVRLQVLAGASRDSLGEVVKDNTASGANVHTAGWS